MLTKDLKEEKTSWGCLILFFAPFVLIGLWSFFYSLFNIYNSVKTENWIKVIAEVNEIKLEYGDDPDGGESFEVKINYEYLINNKKYQNKKIAFGYGMNGTENHENLYYKLENSKKVVAYVNPKDNSDSILIKGVNGSILGMSIFCLMWNSLLSIFLIPIFTKGNPKYNPKRIIPYTVIIWIIGILLFVTESTKINLESKLEIIESKIDKEE